MNKTWEDRVMEEVAIIDRMANADRETFHELFVAAQHPLSDRDGESLQRDGSTATKLYKGKEVFSFWVRGGEINVRAANAAFEPVGMNDREMALTVMAQLTASAIVKARHTTTA